jgi:Mg-chelatase subunit ChlD
VSVAREIREIHYRLAATARGQFPGAHRSRSGDSGFEFRGHAALKDAPDPRRLDLHASLRDPFGDWRVRLFSQRKAVPVVVVADLSASMAYRGRQARPEVLADLVDSLAWSAWRAGDSFGFVGCAAQVQPCWLQLPTRQRQAGALLAQALRGWQPGADAATAEGLLQAPALLGRQRALVFLVSDFHFPLPLLRAVLAGLAAHEVVPVVLRDAQEFELPERWGLLHAQDPETRRRRLVWWRPALRERWRAAQAAQQAALAQAFAEAGLRPLLVEDAFDADAVTRHFQA